MIIKKLSYDLSICKVKLFDNNILSKNFCFIGKTQNELSLVCETKDVPINTTEGGK